MKTFVLIIAFLSLVLVCPAQNTPINQGVLQSDLNGGGHAITNFTGDGSRLTNMTAAQVNADAFGTASNLTVNTNSLTLYVAPWGNDSSNGLTRVSPLATTSHATLVISNTPNRVAMSQVILIDGTNYNDVGPNGVTSVLVLPTNCALVCEPNAWLCLTNETLIWNDNTILKPNLLWYGKDNQAAIRPLLNVAGGITNSSHGVDISGQIISQGDGVHIENNFQNTNGYVVLHDLYIKAVRECFYWDSETNNLFVRIRNCQFYQTNWIFTSDTGGKTHAPILVTQLMSNQLEVSDSSFYWSDQGTNFASAGIVFQLNTTNGGSFTRCTFSPVNCTNANSFDINDTTATNVNSVTFDAATHKLDGSAFTETPNLGNNAITYLPFSNPSITSASFQGNAGALTNIAAANLTGVLPALNAGSLTNLTLVTGAPTLTVIATTLIAQSNLFSLGDNAMILSFIASSSAQQATSNLFAINVTPISTNPVVATIGPAISIDGLWTNNGVGAGTVMAKVEVGQCTSNKVIIRSSVGSLASSAAYSIAIHLDKK